MKRLLIILALLTLIFALIACGKGDNKPEENGNTHTTHSYLEDYKFDDDYHWLVCSGCDKVDNKGAHTFDDNGACTTCKMPLPATKGVVYEVSEDGTDAKVIGYTGTATKVKIADEYQGLPVRTIYEEAFKEKYIAMVVIPDSVTSIGYEAFRNCNALKSVVMPNSITIIDGYAFRNCSSLTSITLPDGIISIGDGAFGECIALESVVIPNSVTTIGENAFAECSSLTSVVIPSSVTHIGVAAFARSNNLDSITVDVNNPNYTSIDGNLYSKDEKTLIQYAIGKADTSFTIPDSVTSIGDQAFYGCSTLTSVVISDSVTSIGDRAFENCTKLTSLGIGNGVTEIGWNSLNCQSLTDINVSENNPTYTSINGNLYSKDGKTLIQYALGKQDTVFTIPDGVTSIGDSAFASCHALTSVVIGNSVTSIGDRAFAFCTSLTSVVIPDSVTSIGRSAFTACSALKSVVIGDGVTEIDSSTFSNCSALTSVVIGNNLKKIGLAAFNDCSSLTDVYYAGTEEQWLNINIFYVNDYLTNATIHYNYVPEEN